MLDWLAYDFVRLALVAAVLAGVLCGLLGPFVVVKRLVALGGGLAHAAFAGIGLFVFLGFDPRLGAALVAVGSALAISIRRHGARNDALIGLLWSVGMAVGLLFVYLRPGYAPDLGGYLFGSLLTLRASDVVLLAVLLLVTAIFLARYWDALVALAFDPEFATVRGLPTRALDRTLLVLVALSMVLLLQMMGVVLVIALLTIPSLVALRLSGRFSAVVAVATAVAVALLLLGLVASFAVDLPPGPSVVLLGAFVLGVAALVSRVRRALATKRLPSAVLVVLAALSVDAGPSRAQEGRFVDCDMPKEVNGELRKLLDDPTAQEDCAWRLRLDPAFDNWRRGASENLPVLAAAAALYAGPEIWGTDYLDWWIVFLSAQLDGAGPELPATVRHFKGSEVFSNIYDAPLGAAVVAVHYWARHGPAASRALADDPRAVRLAELAARYLRATVYAYALAAVPTSVRTGFRNDREHGRGGFQAEGAAPLTLGPYVALAGARSDPLHWAWDGRGPFLARALGRPFHGARGIQPPEEDEDAAVLDWVESHWPRGASLGPYGLSTSERAELDALIERGALPGSLDRALGGIATLVPFHFLAWDGVRATMMEENPNGNTQATFAVAYFTAPRWSPGGHEAVFLFPFNDTRSGVTRGAAHLDLEQRRITATNAPGSRQHPLRKVTVELPDSPPRYHVFLDQRRRERILALTTGS